MENRELATIGVTFIIIVMISMYMFITQQKNNNMNVQATELKILLEKNNAEIDSLNRKIEEMTVRFDETDEKFHK